MFSYYTLLDYNQYISVEHIQYDYINIYMLNLLEVWGKEFDLEII